MAIAEAVTLAVMEMLRLVSDRGGGNAKLDDLHKRIAAAAQEGQHAMEEFVRAELAMQIAALRAELDSRQNALRRYMRRLIVGLTLAVALIAGAVALGLAWYLRRG